MEPACFAHSPDREEVSAEILVCQLESRLWIRVEFVASVVVSILGFRSC